MLGSTQHTITPYKAAASAVQLSLVPDSQLPEPGTPIKYGSEAGRWGAEQLGIIDINRWEENEDASRKLVERCEQLCKELEKERHCGTCHNRGTPSMPPVEAWKKCGRMEGQTSRAYTSSRGDGRTFSRATHSCHTCRCSCLRPRPSRSPLGCRMHTSLPSSDALNT